LPINTNKPPEEWVFPALEFEKATGMRGIGHIYKMPGGITMREAFVHLKNILGNRDFYEFIKAAFAKNALSAKNNEVMTKIGKFAREIIDLNPELKKVSFDKEDAIETEDFIAGVLSGYNPEDIDFFLSDYEWDHEREKRVWLLQVTIGRSIEWAASDLTLEKIRIYYGLENWEPSKKELDEAEKKYKEMFGCFLGKAPQMALAV
jgi:hypothetical protein